MNENEMTQEEKDIVVENLKAIINSKEAIEPTQALNFLIMCAQVCLEHCEKLNQFDKLLVVKALECFEQKFESGQDFVIKVS